MSPELYHAPNLRLQRKKTFGERALTALYWLFPPTFLWGISQLAFKRLLGPLMGTQILPATATKKEGSNAFQKYQEDKKHFATTLEAIKEQGIASKHHCINTHDGAQLDTYEFSTAQDTHLVDVNTIFFIKCIGNSGYFEKRNDETGEPGIINEAISNIKEFNCRYVVFNYRGVGESIGQAKSHEDLVTDVMAQAARLIAMGANPNNIYFKGHSLGAAISTLAASELHAINLPVREYNSRSFSTLSGVKAGEKTAFWGFRKAFWKILFSLTGWEIDAGTAYKKLPETHKDYFCVRSSKETRNTAKTPVVDDETIPHAASIHMVLKHERNALFKKLMQQGDKDEHHVKSEVKKFSRAHKMTTKAPEIGGHNAPGTDLMSRAEESVSAETYFGRFFQRSKTSPTTTDQFPSAHI